MRVADFIRDNRLKARAAQNQLIDKFEPTFRTWSGNVNKKWAEAVAMRSYLHFFDAGNEQQNLWLAQCPVLDETYKKLQNKLGEETYIGEWYTVDQTGIDQFAAATGDQQWIHTDPKRAEQESPYKTTIAHGFLTLALIPMLTESVAVTKTNYSAAKMVVNYGLNRVRFPSPVKEGKRIRARSRVINLLPLKRGLEVVKEVTIEVENSNRIACVADTVVRLYF
ncbi:hypothetical protein A9Q78_09445 [Methylophaga sp. 41_12_T18]|nr:hypothetical protein A9Q78_09445 [Methylophaga sp. 41_12_T18]